MNLKTNSSAYSDPETPIQATLGTGPQYRDRNCGRDRCGNRHARANYDRGPNRYIPDGGVE